MGKAYFIKWFCLARIFTWKRVPVASDGKESAHNVADLGSIPGLGRSPGEGSGNPLEYSCLENPMDRGARWSTVHKVEKRDMTELLNTHIHIT